MESKKYYDKLFKEDRDESWNGAPGKKVILSAFVDLIKNQGNKIIDIGCGNGQWNYFRKTWEEMFKKANLKLFDIDISKKYGALKQGVFFFGKKDNKDKIQLVIL